MANAAHAERPMAPSQLLAPSALSAALISGMAGGCAQAQRRSGGWPWAQPQSCDRKKRDHHLSDLYETRGIYMVAYMVNVC